MAEPKSAKVQHSQAERFREAARELGCEESEERFREIVKKVAKAPHVKQGDMKAHKPKSK